MVANDRKLIMHERRKAQVKKRIGCFSNFTQRSAYHAKEIAEVWCVLLAMHGINF